MATSAPNMGLRRWDVGTDKFNYAELAENFTKLDGHDHTSGKGRQIPTGGIADSAVTTLKLNDEAVTAQKIANNTITSAKLAPGVGQPPLVTSLPLNPAVGDVVLYKAGTGAAAPYWQFRCETAAVQGGAAANWNFLSGRDTITTWGNNNGTDPASQSLTASAINDIQYLSYSGGFNFLFNAPFPGSYYFEVMGNLLYTNSNSNTANLGFRRSTDSSFTKVATIGPGLVAGKFSSTQSINVPAPGVIYRLALQTLAGTSTLQHEFISLSVTPAYVRSGSV